MPDAQDHQRIRELWCWGFTLARLAKRYSCSTSSIHKIVKERPAKLVGRDGLAGQ
jgi:uncharacterized protein YjcR